MLSIWTVAQNATDKFWQHSRIIAALWGYIIKFRNLKLFKYFDLNPDLSILGFCRSKHRLNLRKVSKWPRWIIRKLHSGSAFHLEMLWPVEGMRQRTTYDRQSGSKFLNNYVKTLPWRHYYVKTLPWRHNWVKLNDLDYSWCSKVCVYFGQLRQIEFAKVAPYSYHFWNGTPWAGLGEGHYEFDGISFWDGSFFEPYRKMSTFSDKDPVFFILDYESHSENDNFKSRNSEGTKNISIVEICQKLTSFECKFV